MAAAPSDTVRVWLIQFSPVDSSLTAEDSTLTCMDGGTPYYEFDGKPAGSYMVKAKLQSSIPGMSGYVPTYGLSTSLWDSAATIIHASATDTQHINMIYGIVPPGPGFIGGLISAGAGRGTSGGVPVVGMLVYLKDATNTILTYTYTDAAGMYAFSGLGNGSYIVYPVDYRYRTIPWTSVSLTATSETVNGVNFYEHTTHGMITPEGTLKNPVEKETLLNISPNPANDELSILMENGAYSSLAIISSIGQEMIKQQINAAETKVNISSLAAGVYYATFSGMDGRKVIKFVKL